jgi:hypothetical protein
MVYAYGVNNANSTTSPDKFDMMGIPFAQTISGFMYDKDLFGGEDTGVGYYIAGEDAFFAEEYTSLLLEGTPFEEFATVSFVTNEDVKSVGPNGIAGDYDDGLPSTFIEFVVLCERLAENGVAPISYSGEYPTYLSLGLGSMFFSLLGYDNAKAMMEFQADSLNVVTGFEDTNFFSDAFSSDMNIKVPKVTQIQMTEASGYYHTWTLENYLVLALAELINDQGWKSSSALYTKSHTETQYNFIFGIEPDMQDVSSAMMAEGSYWYNEAVDAGTFASYKKYYGKTADDRGIAWMSMPVNIFAPVTGENAEVTNFGVTESIAGEKQTLDDVGNGALMVNGNVANDPVIMEAVEDYLLFKCSNAELNRFAADAGYTMQLKYTYDEDIMLDAPKYIQETYKLFNDSNIVTTFAEAQTWRGRPDYTFDRSYDSDFLTP